MLISPSVSCLLFQTLGRRDLTKGWFWSTPAAESFNQSALLQRIRKVWDTFPPGRLVQPETSTHGPVWAGRSSFSQITHLVVHQFVYSMCTIRSALALFSLWHIANTMRKTLALWRLKALSQVKAPKPHMPFV